MIFDENFYSEKKPRRGKENFYCKVGSEAVKNTSSFYIKNKGSHATWSFGAPKRQIRPWRVDGPSTWHLLSRYSHMTP